MRRVVALAFLAMFALFASTSAYGQAVYGNIVGSVTDTSGAVVANAKVTITDTGRGVSVSTITNESGNFTQRFLIVGRYQVRVEAQGFKAAVQEVGVSVDQEVSLDIKLQPGAVSEEVTITAEAPLLKTERADVAITFSEKSLTTLPLLNRRFTSVEIFTPGVTAWPGQTAASEDPQGSYRKIVNGQSFAGTSHLLDGTDNHDSMLGLIVINPTLESVTEAKVT
ncbi:MAG TPA: carboxypeptidase-like regulatory domain-containing protein, partial [Blastocatellia bacterium]|nr:carboxypeptidase-like regulatory domain-containing protein [Blastocatellia bacterium]